MTMTQAVYTVWVLYYSVSLLCSYFRQVEDETLRISVLAPWAVRLPADDFIVDGCLIPADTPIIQALGVGLKDTTSWTEGELEE